MGRIMISESKRQILRPPDHDQGILRIRSQFRTLGSSESEGDATGSRSSAIRECDGPDARNGHLQERCLSVSPDLWMERAWPGATDVIL